METLRPSETTTDETMALLKMALSPYVENIFYADLFTINGKNWMVMGEGKSTAARSACNKDPKCDLARDGVALTRNGDDLYAHFDLGASGVNAADPVKHKVDAIAYCVEAKHSSKLFSNTGNVIVEADNNMVAAFASGWPYSGSAAMHLVTQQQWNELENPVRRLKFMTSLTDGVTSTKFLLVPYMPTVEDKADLYRNYVL